MGPPLDLGSLASVRAFAAAYKKRHRRLDCLVNNAGAHMPAGGPAVPAGLPLLLTPSLLNEAVCLPRPPAAGSDTCHAYNGCTHHSLVEAGLTLGCWCCAWESPTLPDAPPCRAPRRWCRHQLHPAVVDPRGRWRAVPGEAAGRGGACQRVGRLASTPARFVCQAPRAAIPAHQAASSSATRRVLSGQGDGCTDMPRPVVGSAHNALSVL